MAIKRFVRVECDNEGCEEALGIEVQSPMSTHLPERDQIREGIHTQGKGEWIILEQNGCQTITLCSVRCLSDYGQERARQTSKTMGI